MKRHRPGRIRSSCICSIGDSERYWSSRSGSLSPIDRTTCFSRFRRPTRRLPRPFPALHKSESVAGKASVASLSSLQLVTHPPQSLFLDSGYPSTIGGFASRIHAPHRGPDGCLLLRGRQCDPTAFASFDDAPHRGLRSPSLRARSSVIVSRASWKAGRKSPMASKSSADEETIAS